MASFKEYNRLLLIEEAARELEGYFSKTIENNHLNIKGSEVALLGFLDRLNILREVLRKEKLEFNHADNKSEYPQSSNESSGE